MQGAHGDNLCTASEPTRLDAETAAGPTMRPILIPTGRLPGQLHCQRLMQPLTAAWVLAAAAQYGGEAASTQAAVKGYLCGASWQALRVTTVRVQAVYKDSTPRHRLLQVKKHVPGGRSSVEYCSHPHPESLLLLIAFCS